MCKTCGIISVRINLDLHQNGKSKTDPRDHTLCSDKTGCGSETVMHISVDSVANRRKKSLTWKTSWVAMKSSWSEIHNKFLIEIFHNVLGLTRPWPIKVGQKWCYCTSKERRLNLWCKTRVTDCRHRLILFDGLINNLSFVGLLNFAVTYRRPLPIPTVRIFICTFGYYHSLCAARTASQDYYIWFLLMFPGGLLPDRPCDDRIVSQVWKFLPRDGPHVRDRSVFPLHFFRK